MVDYRLDQSGQQVQDILNGAAMQVDLTAENERATEAEQTLQGNINDEETRAKGVEGTLQDNIDAEETRAKAAEKQNADDIDALEAVVPTGASSENKLATESFVNDSVATATATFRGTYNLVSDLHLTLEATHTNIANALATAVTTANNNDFVFVQIPTSEETPTVIGSIERYKYNGFSWSYEYTLNNSGFTQAQWDAVNSGITGGDVAKLRALPTNTELTTLLNGLQGDIDAEEGRAKAAELNLQGAIDAEEVRAKAAEKANADDIDALEAVIPSTASSENKVATASDVSSLSAAIEAILLLIPSAASSVNQLADKAFVNSSIATNTGIFRGTYNLVSDLHLTLAATHAQIGNALALAILEANNNDYAFVQIPTVATAPTEIAQTDRYKWNGSTWEYEYTLNNSGFTSAQWTAINSGITSALVSKLSALPTNSELTSEIGTLVSAINAINQKIPSSASLANKLVDTAALESYIIQVLGVLTVSYNITSTDGHFSFHIEQVDGKITAVEFTTSDVASQTALDALTIRVDTAEGTITTLGNRMTAAEENITSLGGRMTTAEGNITSLTGRVSTNEEDIAQLQAAYEALTQSEIIIGALPASGVANKIYRVPDTNSYSDYMWNGTQFVLMATYNNAIDDEPTPGSNNLVKSGGVLNSIIQNGPAFDLSAYNAVGGVLARYKDPSAALTALNALDSVYKQPGMSFKFVQSSDNKYVQYRYTGTAVTGNPNPFLSIDNWEISAVERELEDKKTINYTSGSSGFVIDGFNVLAGETYTISAINGRITAERVVNQQGQTLEQIDTNIPSGTTKIITFHYNGRFSYYYVAGNQLELKIERHGTVNYRLNTIDAEILMVNQKLEACKKYLKTTIIQIGNNTCSIEENPYQNTGKVILRFTDTTNAAFYLRLDNESSPMLPVIPSSTSVEINKSEMLFCVVSGNSASMVVSSTVIDGGILLGIVYRGFLVGGLINSVLPHLNLIQNSNLGHNVIPSINSITAPINAFNDNLSDLLRLTDLESYKDIDVSPEKTGWSCGYISDEIDNIVNNFSFKYFIYDIKAGDTFVISGKEGLSNYTVYDNSGIEIYNGSSHYFPNKTSGTFVMPANARYFVVTYNTGTDSGENIRILKRLPIKESPIVKKVDMLCPDETSVVKFNEIGYELNTVIDSQGGVAHNVNTAVSNMFGNDEFISGTLHYNGTSLGTDTLFFRYCLYDNGTFRERGGRNLPFDEKVLIPRCDSIRFLVIKKENASAETDLPVTADDMEHIEFVAENSATKFTYQGSKISIAPKMSWKMLARATYGNYLQDGDCYNDIYFQFYDQRKALSDLKGLEVINLLTGEILQQITLGYEDGHHNNAVCFGPYKWDNNDGFPLIYTSGLMDSKVFVYRITGTRGSYSLTKVQTITVQDLNAQFTSFIDKERHLLITENTDNVTTHTATYKSFDLPDPHSGDVDLSVANAVDSFDIDISNPYIVPDPVANASQGGCIIDAKLYQMFGFANRRGWLQVINLRTHVTESTVNMTDIGLNFEPEGAFYYNGKLGAMFNGGSGRFIVELNFY